MGSLTSALTNAANALNVYQSALQVVSNDVTNASTPGYVKQTVALSASRFDVTLGLPGGVTISGVQSARSAYAEQNVRQKQTSVGFYQGQTQELSQLSNVFDLTGKTGVGPAIDNLFQSFSALSVSPNDASARQNVLQQAQSVASAFQHASASIASASEQVATDTRSAVETVNQLTATLAQINQSHVQDFSGNVDAGVDAKLNSTLEELSKQVSISAYQQPNGEITVYLNGQTPLVAGDQSFPLETDLSTPQARILDANGKDISGEITDGQLGGFLDAHNSKIPSYQADLNTLAQGVADQVNTALSNGVDESGATPTETLFHYDGAVGADTSISVNPNLTQDQIAAALPGAPGGNGNALQLSALGSAKTLSGYTFSQFYGNLGAKVGKAISDAQNSQDAQNETLTQAQTLRQSISGVSLNDEAERLVQFQQAYQATSKLVTVLDTLTQSLLSILN